MKSIGFLSFGHWAPSPGSLTRSGSDALLQSIELAVAAEELGADGAYFRVHHFARQLGVSRGSAEQVVDGWSSSSDRGPTDTPSDGGPGKLPITTRHAR